MPAYRMTLTMLSPVHIGTGEEIEPIDYVVRRPNPKEPDCLLHALDLPRLLARLTDAQRREFNDAADRGGSLFLRKFMDRLADPERDARWTAPCDPDLYELYQKGLQKEASLLAVNVMTRDPATGRPYIPGSSLKGALRTAWVSHKASVYTESENRERLRDRDFEPEILGYRTRDRDGARADIRADPFRAVSVGDALLCDDSNYIDRVRIYHPGKTRGVADPSSIQMFYDATLSLLDDEPIIAEGRLLINERLARTPTQGARGAAFPNCVADAISAEPLLDACNSFYRPRLESELERFPVLKDVAGKLRAKADALDKGKEALIRLGRFSHRECVTVAPDGGGPSKLSATRSLVAGALPLGWAALTLERV